MANKFTQSHNILCGKNDNFYMLRKKIKKMSLEKTFFSSEICLLDTGQMKNRFSIKRPSKYIECENICEDFFPEFFDIQNYD